MAAKASTINVGPNPSTLEVVHPAFSQVQARIPKERLSERGIADGMLGDIPTLSLHVVVRQRFLGVDPVAQVVRGSGSPEPGEVRSQVHVPEAFGRLEIGLESRSFGFCELGERKCGHETSGLGDGFALVVGSEGALGEDGARCLLDEASIDDDPAIGGVPLE